MNTTYATAADVQAVLGRQLTTEEVALVECRLAQVERMILRRTRSGRADRR
jgi:hypothetical protein